MDKAKQINELLRKITGTDRPTFSFMPMEVKSVDGDLCVCLLGELEIPDVRLVAIAEGSADGLLITPKEGSIVMVADLSAGTLRELMVVGYTEIASIRFHQGDTTVTTDGGKVRVEVGDVSAELTGESATIKKGEDTTVLAEDKKVSITAGKSSAELVDGEITLNGGSFGGLVKIEELRRSFDSLKTYCETMKEATSAGIKAVGIAAAANGTTGATTFDSAMASASIRIANMENDKITH